MRIKDKYINQKQGQVTEVITRTINGYECPLCGGVLVRSPFTSRQGYTNHWIENGKFKPCTDSKAVAVRETEGESGRYAKTVVYEGEKGELLALTYSGDHSYPPSVMLRVHSLDNYANEARQAFLDAELELEKKREWKNVFVDLYSKWEQDYA